jgi:multiple sugar transport system permease protein
LSKEIKGKKAFRMIYFIPYVCSVVAVTLMWKYMFNTNFGVINQMLGRTGDNAIDWLGDSAYFSWAVIIMSVWSGMGYSIILYTAAFTNVNKEMVEAATIDGASTTRCFFSIILPSISPTSFYLLVMGVIGALQSFATTNVLAADGGPDRDGITIVFYLYRNMFQYDDMVGVASATAWVLAFFIGVLTIIQFWGSKKWVSYD